VISPLIWVAAAALVASLGTCVLLVMTQKWHGALSLDHDLDGVQKIHHDPVPRVGGLGLALGLVVAAIGTHLTEKHAATIITGLLISAIPVFMAGLIEDITKRVSVKTRLLASFVSAGLAAWLVGARLLNLDMPLLDALIQHPFISLAFTAFAVGGMTNAVNIIDGLNGLASGSVVLMLAGLGAIAWLHNDMVVMQLCLMGIAATAGFLLLNYPFGRIFLGDGGAYLAGFWTAECGVLLLLRNPEVSTWAVLLACVYPVWETIFSMYRRHIVGGVSSGQPDVTHLHHLLLKHLPQKYLGRLGAPWLHHGIVSACIWGLVAGCQILAVVLNSKISLLVVSTAIFAAAYCALYRLFSEPEVDQVPDSIAIR